MFCRLLLLTLLAHALPASLPAAGIPIAGRILTSDGAPIAGAEVHLETIPPTYERAVLRLAGQPGPVPVARTRTAGDGGFELSAPEAGMWAVVAAAPGRLTAEYRLVPLVDAAELPDATLEPATELAVRLLDAAGAPRAGAVGAVGLGSRERSWRPRLRLAAAGDDGLARLPVGQGETIQLEVLAEGHPLVVREVAGERAVTVALPAGVAGTVRFLDRHRRPLAGAVAFQGSALLPLGLSDQEGRLPLVLQREAPPALRVSTAERWHGSFELDLAAAAGAVQALRLDPPLTVRGRVLDLASRDPVPGALVWSVRGELAVTDRQGRYALDTGVYQSRWVQAAAAGYERSHVQRDDAESDQAPAIGLTPLGSLIGTVVDQEGSPLAGVAITLEVPPSGGLSPAGMRLMAEGWQGRTSRRGAFRIARLASGVGFELTFEAEGFAAQTRTIEPLEAFERRAGLEVVLRRGRLGFGRVIDQDELPVAGAEARLRRSSSSDDPLAMMRSMRRQNEDAARDPGHLTDAEGRFTIADLAAGRYDLEVRATGFAPAKVPGLRVTEDEDSLDFGTLVLIPGASIEGRVTDADGDPLAGALVRVELGGQGFMGRSPFDPRSQAETDAKGRFVLADLLPGQAVILVVTKEGYGSASLAGQRPPGEEPVAIVLRPAGRLRGKVTDRRGEPVEGATVMTHMDPREIASAALLQVRDHQPWVRTGADGRYLIADVEPGTLRVSVQAERYQQQVRQGIEMAAGADLELDFVLEVGAEVEGTVRTAAGEPVALASVMVSEQRAGPLAGGMASAHGRTDAEGRYRVAGAPIGAVSIAVFHDNNQRLTKNLELRPGSNLVDLVLEPGFEIAGRVVAADGTPVSGAAVSLEEVRQPGVAFVSTGSSQTVSTAGGAFTLSGVGAGRVAVIASREGYAPARSEAFELSADVAGLVLELHRGARLAGRIVGLDLDQLATLELIAFSEQGGIRRGQVDFAAEYAFEALASGRWHVQARVAGSGRSSSLQVEIPEGATVVEQDIEFGTGFALSGVVIDGGAPLAGAHVTAATTARSAGMGMTGAGGRFQIEHLAAGSYQVMVVAGAGILHMEALELHGDHELRIEIATGTLTGTVRDAAGGQPLAGVAIALERIETGGEASRSPPFGFGMPAETDSSGYFRLPRVHRGSWRVVATKANYAPGETMVTVAGDGGPEVEIQLAATEGVSFQVALASGAALPAVQVALLDPSGRRLASGSYPVNGGTVRVSTVPPGTWELIVQGGPSATTRVVVTAPGDQGRLVLATGGALDLRVPALEQELIASVVLTGPDGKPLVAAMGIAFGPGEWPMASGRATVPNLLPGTWTFTITGADGRTWSGSATVTAGATTEVSLP